MAGQVDAQAPAPSAAPGPPTPPTQFGYTDADAAAAARVAFTGPQKYLGLAALLLMVGATVWFAFTSQPASTARPDLFGGSIVLSNGSRDNPTVVDLATGNPTLILTVGEPFGFPLTESKDRRANLRYIRSEAGDYVVNRTNGDTNLLRTDHLVVNKKRPYKLPAPGDNAGAVDGVTAKTMGARLFLIRHSGAATDVVLLDEDIIRSAGPEDANQPKGISLDAGSANADITSAVAGDSLWLLVNKGSGAGVTGKELRKLTEAPAVGDLLLQSETIADFGPFSQVVAVGDTIVVVDPDAATATVVGPASTSATPVVRTIAVPGIAGAQDILPAEPADGSAATSLWLATFVDGGWKAFGVDVAPAAVTPVIGPFAMPGTGSADQLARPVVNAGSLWAASRTDGHVTRLSLTDGTPADVPSGPAYPDPPDPDGERELARNPDAFRDIEVVSIGPRVLVNVPFAKRALLFETDAGVRTEIVKTEAPELDPTAPPIPGNKRQDENNPSNSSTSTTQARPGESSTTTSSIQVQKELPCEERDQQPRKPSISDNYLPSAKEVRIEWTYNPQDPRDCFPSRYRIEVSSGEGNSTAPPEPIWVTSTGNRHAAVVAGLRPNRTWRIVVVAALGQRETPSDPIDVDTADTGPDAARNPKVDNGREAGWNLSWDACQADECDRQATEWEITIDPTACVNPFPIGALPPKLTVGGRNRGRFVSLDELPPDFVGAQARFGIAGIDGSLRSDTTVWTECAEGWRAPTVAPKLTPFYENTGDTFRIGADADPLSLHPRVAGSQEALLIWKIDNVSTGAASDTRQVTKDGVLPNTNHTISLQLSHHGRLSPMSEVTLNTGSLKWTTPGVSLSPIERASLDEHSPDFDVVRTALTFANVPNGSFSGTVRVVCGATTVVSMPYTVAAPGATLAPMQWGIIDNPSDCAVRLDMQEVAAPGTPFKYSGADVANTGQWPPLQTGGAFAPPKAVITVVGWETLPVDGVSTYDATGYWRWEGTLASPPDPAVGQWVDNGVVRVQYDVGVVRANTRITVGTNPSPACSLVPAAATGEWLVPGACFTLNPDGVTPTDTNVVVTTKYLGALNFSMLDAPVAIPDTPRLPKPTDPPP